MIPKLKLPLPALTLLLVISCSGQTLGTENYLVEYVRLHPERVEMFLEAHRKLAFSGPSFMDQTLLFQLWFPNGSGYAYNYVMISVVDKFSDLERSIADRLLKIGLDENVKMLIAAYSREYSI